LSPGNTGPWKLGTSPLRVLSLFEEPGDKCGRMSHCEGSRGQMPKEWGQAGRTRVQGRKWKRSLVWEVGFDPSSRGWAGFK